MRRVIKTHEPAELASWRALANEDWTPKYADMPRAVKQAVHTQLAIEQGWTCCYCGREIDLRSSHIEHFEPQSTASEMALVYTNIFASCIRENGPDLPSICGHKKSAAFVQNMMISPLEPDCEQHFTYTADGQILSIDQRAETMVNILGLDNHFLSNRRQNAIEGAFDAEFLASATVDDLQSLAQGFRLLNPDGHLRPFFHVVAHYAEQLANNSI